MIMDEIRFVDTTLRDGHQSLWAEGMLTGMILPIAERMDQAGFEAIELVAPSFFKKPAGNSRKTSGSAFAWCVSASPRRRCAASAIAIWRASR